MKLIKIAVIGCILTLGSTMNGMNIATTDIPMATPLHLDFRIFLDQRVAEIRALNAFATGILLTREQAFSFILREPRTFLRERFNQWLEERRVNLAADFVDIVTRRYDPRSGKCPRFVSPLQTCVRNA